AAVDDRAGVAEVDGGFEDAVKVAGRLGAVVAATAELDRAGTIVADRLLHGIEYRGRLVGHLHQVAAASLFLDLLHRAGEVDVDHVVAELDENLRALGDL